MSDLEQAYIEGFVKRAAEHGLSEAEAAALVNQLKSRKASVPLNALFNGGILGGIHDYMSDKDKPEQAPDRLSHIFAPGFVGGIGSGAC